MPPPTKPTPAYRAMLAEAKKRRHQALKMREAGKKPKEIAQILGITRQRAEQMIEQAQKERGMGRD